MTALGEAEISERVAILKKLRAVLLAQRDKFYDYLNVLEHQENDIREADEEKLTAHMELEQSIVREIFSFQKIIDPLHDIYRIAYPQSDGDIQALESSLETLKTKVLDRNKRNQDLLRGRMTEIRKKIVDVRTNKRPNAVYSTQSEPTLIDIKT